MYSYLDVIAELVSISKMPTEDVDMMEEKDYADQAQHTIECFVEECQDTVELSALLAVAKRLHFYVKPIEVRIAELQHLEMVKRQREYEFDMATFEVADRKHHKVQSLFVAYEATVAVTG